MTGVPDQTHLQFAAVLDTVKKTMQPVMMQIRDADPCLCLLLVHRSIGNPCELQ